jgi:hypothetical protein
LRPHRKKTSIQEMIRICADTVAHHIQEAALAAALKEVIHLSKKGCKGACFSCRQLGYFAKECHKGKRPPSGGTGIVSSFPGSRALPPGVFSRCYRGRHWANECRFQTDVEGLTLQERETSVGASPGPNKQ